MDWSYLTLCILNANLSYTATILNIVTIYAIMKTPSLSKNFKTLLLSLAVSDLGVGLLAQPMFAAHIMDSKQNNETMNKSYNATYVAFHTPTDIFIFASLFSVTALCADRYLAIYFHLRYQELVTYKRVTIAVTSIWVFSALTPLFSFWIPTNIMFVYYAIQNLCCIITTTSLSVKLKQTLRRHITQIQIPQEAQNHQVESVQRNRKSAMASLYVYLVFIVCYLPSICVSITIATISEPRNDLQHLHFYTLTLMFLNSTLNPLIYCWKMKQIRKTVTGKLRDVFSRHT